MMRPLARTAILLLALASTALPLVAGHGPGHGPGPHGHGPGAVLGPAAGILHGLDLSAEQRDRIHALVDAAMRGELGSIGETVAEAHRALDLEVWDPGATDASLAEAVTTLAEPVQRLQQARHRLAMDVLAVLTEAQRAELRQRLADMPPPPPPAPSPPAPPAPPAPPRRER